MSTASTERPAELYERDETAWLDLNSELIREGRLDEVDYENLAEFLASMAIRDRREVASRLVALIAHLLKWRYQPDRRTRSWNATIVHQRQELADCLESGTLSRHADQVLGRSYEKAVRLAAVETGLSRSAFPAECPYTLDEVLDGPLAA